MHLRLISLIAIAIVLVAVAAGELIFDLRAPRSALHQMHAITTTLTVRTADYYAFVAEMEKKYGPNAATSLGLHPFPAPTGATSRPYRDRPACNDCGFDGNFGCPIGAKGSPAVTSLRDAIATGNVTLLAN